MSPKASNPRANPRHRQIPRPPPQQRGRRVLSGPHGGSNGLLCAPRRACQSRSSPVKSTRALLGIVQTPRRTNTTPGTGRRTSRVAVTACSRARKVAIKDCICVARACRFGSRVLEGYVPEVDATVVTRVLDAGGAIAGKAACEDLCFSGGSHTCATGPIRNPHNPEHSAGGSSGGSVGEPFLALRMCRRPAAARAASAGRPLLHDRSVLRHARIADRICRRSCLHDCTPLHAASDVSDVLSPLTVACFRRAAPPGALRRLGGDPVLGIGLSPSTLLVRERRPVWRFILWSFTDEPRRNGGVVLSY